MLMTALVPALSRPFSSDRAANLMVLEICSAKGLSYAKAPGSDTSDKAGGAMNDCPYCRIQADLPVLPSAPTFAPHFAITSERPALFYHAATPPQVWVAANPRGPPAA